MCRKQQALLATLHVDSDTTDFFLFLLEKITGMEGADTTLQEGYYDCLINDNSMNFGEDDNFNGVWLDETPPSLLPSVNLNQCDLNDGIQGADHKEAFGLVDPVNEINDESYSSSHIKDSNEGSPLPVINEYSNSTDSTSLLSDVIEQYPRKSYDSNFNFVSYSLWDDSEVYTFDPTTRGQTVSELTSKSNVASIRSSINNMTTSADNQFYHGSNTKWNEDNKLLLDDEFDVAFKDPCLEQYWLNNKFSFKDNDFVNTHPNSILFGDGADVSYESNLLSSPQRELSATVDEVLNLQDSYNPSTEYFRGAYLEMDELQTLSETSLSASVDLTERSKSVYENIDETQEINNKLENQFDETLDTEMEASLQRFLKITKLLTSTHSEPGTKRRSSVQYDERVKKIVALKKKLKRRFIANAKSRAEQSMISIKSVHYNWPKNSSSYHRTNKETIHFAMYPAIKKKYMEAVPKVMDAANHRQKKKIPVSKIQVIQKGFNKADLKCKPRTHGTGKKPFSAEADSNTKNNCQKDHQRSSIILPVGPTGCSIEIPSSIPFDVQSLTTGNTPEKAPGNTCETSSSKSSEKALVNASEKSPVGSFEKALGNALEKSSGIFFGKALGNASKIFSGNSFEKTPGNASEKYPHNSFEKAPGNAFEKSPGNSFGKAPGNASKMFPGNPFEKALKDASEKAPGNTFRKASEHDLESPEISILPSSSEVGKPELLIESTMSNINDAPVESLFKRGQVDTKNFGNPTKLTLTKGRKKIALNTENVLKIQIYTNSPKRMVVTRIREPELTNLSASNDSNDVTISKGIQLIRDLLKKLDFLSLDLAKQIFLPVKALQRGHLNDSETECIVRQAKLLQTLSELSRSHQMCSTNQNCLTCKQLLKTNDELNRLKKVNFLPNETQKFPESSDWKRDLTIKSDFVKINNFIKEISKTELKFTDKNSTSLDRAREGCKMEVSMKAEFSLQRLQVGKFSLQSKGNQNSMKVIFKPESVVYEIDLQNNKTEFLSSATISLSRQDIIGVNIVDKVITFEIKTVPVLRILDSEKREVSLKKAKGDDSLSVNLLAFLKKQLSIYFLHKLTIDAAKPELPLRKFILRAWPHMLITSNTEEVILQRSYYEGRYLHYDQREKRQKHLQKLLQDLEAFLKNVGGEMRGNESSCDCVTGCGSPMDCQCCREGKTCSNCSCNSCRNPLNELQQLSVDIPAARMDVCLMQNIYDLSSLELRSILRKDHIMSCCGVFVKTKRLIPNVVECIGCQQYLSFSWCSKEVCIEANKQRNHCILCLKCQPSMYRHCCNCSSCALASTAGKCTKCM